MKLKDKIALVTGAGSGLGQASILALAREGAKVAVNDIHDNRIQETVSLVEKEGGEAFGVNADVSSAKAVKGMFEKIVKKFGTLDILVNNAGFMNLSAKMRENFPKIFQEAMTTGTVTMSPQATRFMTDDEWQSMIDLHLYGTFYCTREALNIMEDKGYGKIVNMGSICGLSASCAGSPHYSAAKGGILAFTKSVAQEVIGRGVYVNALAPGFVETPGLIEQTLPDVLTLVKMRTPLGRLGTPEEIATLVVYLASDESNFMVGAVLSPNGGMVISIGY
ncbi:MAG: 3-oxoacyl-ACP reductase FabG [Deltaproteobacteria bacterium]|nr:3-oxoacyl-ACP reductase FabG [Deltaproteobacteria bacterium]